MMGGPPGRPADRAVFDRDQSHILAPAESDRHPIRAGTIERSEPMTALDVLPTAKDLQKKLALAEAEKAAEAARRAAAEEAEKKGRRERTSNPRGGAAEVET